MAALLYCHVTMFTLFLSGYRVFSSSFLNDKRAVSVEAISHTIFLIFLFTWLGMWALQTMGFSVTSWRREHWIISRKDRVKK